MVNYIETLETNNISMFQGFLYSYFERIYIMNWYKKSQSISSYVSFRDRETQSVAEASLLVEDFVMGTKGMYFFNRLQSNKPGQGGGTKVLKQLLEYSEQVGIPILNQVNAYGDLSQEQLVEFYKKHGFVSFGAEFGDDLLVYYPKNLKWKSE